MTTLRKDFLRIPTVDYSGRSSLPNMAMAELPPKKGCPTDTEEEDGLFNDYGHVRSAYPYRMQDLYTREFTKDGLDSIVLENDHLKAVFVPAMGGKLWSLFDKDAGRELFFANPVCRPANLAVRNAWTSGGTEWNFGFLGHHPYTCSQMHTAILKNDDGEPVLRMYEFERIRKMVYQMDFWIPEDSKYLHCRMRLYNTNECMTPVYWWSNTAAPSPKGARLVTNADVVYTMNDGKLKRYSLPFTKPGVDISYPETAPISMDHFFRTRDGEMKFETLLNPQGYGLVQASTERLKGRKIFVWGQGRGGRRFQEFLSGEGCDGRYYEIQAGLAYSQTENLPMPAKTVWEWLEVYGPLQIEPEKLGEEWNAIQGIVAGQLNQNGLTRTYLQEVLENTKAMAKRPADEVLCHGSGWAALENLRRQKTGQKIMCPHLDFGATAEEQEDWVKLLSESTVGQHKPDAVPKSWMLQKEWEQMLETAAKKKDKDNWYAYLQLGCLHTMQESADPERAENELKTSIRLEPNAWAYYALAELYRMTGKKNRRAKKKGIPFDRTKAQCPEKYNFRMNTLE